jgi:lipase chaperone LimK
MKNLSLHASGHDDYFKALERKYKLETAAIRNDSSLTEIQKSEALEVLEKKYEKDIRNAQKSLF